MVWGFGFEFWASGLVHYLIDNTFHIVLIWFCYSVVFDLDLCLGKFVHGWL